jgi:hypothetical protein
LWIIDILVRVRIRIRGSVPLTYVFGSGSYSGSCSFHLSPSPPQSSSSSRDTSVSIHLYLCSWDQCCGCLTFWKGYGSGSADPYHGSGSYSGSYSGSCSFHLSPSPPQSSSSPRDTSVSTHFSSVAGSRAVEQIHPIFFQGFGSASL